MILKKSWRQGGPGPKAPLDPQVTRVHTRSHSNLVRFPVNGRAISPYGVTSMLTAYLTPTQPQYTKVKVPSTQDKHYVS